jgi:tRNA(Ile)-lysidine synthase
MLNAFTKYIQQEKLFSAKDKILLAVSGGIDSVVLCEMFHKAGFKFGIAHCNFGLRADESDGDEAFVEALAEKYDVSFHATAFDTSAFAKKNKLSIQAAARELRYQWFENIRENFNYKFIATAHHSDDSIETFFINLIRGTGISGLHGILPKQGNIIRPMLFTNKEKITSFTKKSKLKYREDSSNASDKYVRNKLRHKIIPELKKINPSIESAIAQNIKHLRDVELIYKKAIESERKIINKENEDRKIIPISSLKKLKPLSPYLFEFLYPLGFNSSVIEKIILSLDNTSGKQFFSETHRLIKDRSELIIERIRETKEELILISQDQKELRSAEFRLKFKAFKADQNKKIKMTAGTANLDYDKLFFPLEIRKWQKGDVFYPLGMKGKKKLSDLFIDKKLSLDQKENIRILTSEGKIVWVIGMRLDDRFKITDKTKKIYCVEQV